MKATKLYFVLLPVTFLLFCMCGKEEGEEQLPQDLVFHSLTAERDSVYPGEEVKIKATASGISLTYYWSASLGDILGAGAEVIYVSSPCQIGTNQITCEISNGNQSESKTIDIVVLE